MKMVLGVLVMAVALAFTPLVAAAEWSTSYGTMILPDSPESGAIRLTYGTDEGRIIGTLLRPKCTDCGFMLEGLWVEAGSDQDCTTAEDGSIYWGNVTLEFNPAFTSFEGNWDYCGGGRTYSWSGEAGTLRLPSQDR